MKSQELNLKNPSSAGLGSNTGVKFERTREEVNTLPKITPQPQTVESVRSKMAERFPKALDYISFVDPNLPDLIANLNQKGFIKMDYDPNFTARARDLKISGDAVTLFSAKLDPSGKVSLQNIHMYFDKSSINTDGQALVTLLHEATHAKRALEGRYIIGNYKAEEVGAYTESIALSQKVAKELRDRASRSPTSPSAAAEYRRVATEIDQALVKDIEDLKNMRKG